jgi:phosphotransferase system HPr (HPr) family protein
MATVEQTLVLINKVGLHARPAAQFVQTAAGYSASIMIEYAGQTADAKRILQVLQLGAEKGAELQVRAEGADAREAVAALAALVAERFGEPE